MSYQNDAVSFLALIYERRMKDINEEKLSKLQDFVEMVVKEFKFPESVSEALSDFAGKTDVIKNKIKVSTFDGEFEVIRDKNGDWAIKGNSFAPSCDYSNVPDMCAKEVEKNLHVLDKLLSARENGNEYEEYFD
jgi:hypothetical protein